MAHKQLMTQSELSNLLGGVSERTIERWRLEGRGPRFTKIGIMVRYNIVDVEDWLEQNTYASTAECKIAASF